MPSRPLKPRQYATAHFISTRCFASVRRGKPRYDAESMKGNCGSLFSELSVVEIKKASAAPRECVSTVVCYLCSEKY
ncbi:hypothetical protein DPMN_058165 [Dreissena polymorpha]|uniref:Uncharacterized protein n=1 Tax=Dreissena polymorpha TaxID=45954 RepID=A0A9D4C1H6_DREPO|nr:hypothetical protein DPMN_058165 [Dreissena polymorpha]